MSLNQSETTAVDNLLTCAICLEWFESPRKLPCAHVYCYKHLEGLTNAHKIRCPDCRVEHEVPNEDVGQFPVDYCLQEFINIEKEKAGNCKECKCGKNISKCEHCDQKLCNECQENHKITMTGLLYHQLRNFAKEFLKNDAEVEQDLKLKKQQTEHKQQELEKEELEINERIDKSIQELELERESLLNPIEQKSEKLAIQLKKIEKSSKAAELYKAIKDKLFETDCTIKELQQMSENLQEIRKTFEEAPNQSDYKEYTQPACDANAFQPLNEYTRPACDDNAGQPLKVSGSRKIIVKLASLRTYIYNKICDINKWTVQVKDYVIKRKSVLHSKVALLSCLLILLVVIWPFSPGYNRSSSFELLRTLNGTESGREFNQPYGLTVCKYTDHVYLTQLSESSIHEYDNNGYLVRKAKTIMPNACGKTDKVPYPHGIAIDSQQRVITTCSGCHCEQNVFIYDKDMNFNKSFGNSGCKNGQFRSPTGLAVDHEDNIYITDTGNKRIQVFDSDGIFIRLFSNRYVNSPAFIQITNDQKILVTDRDDDTSGVHVLTLDGQYITSFGKEIKQPFGITQYKNGHILVADQENKKIEVYTKELVHYSTINLRSDNFTTTMFGIAITAENKLFVSDTERNEVHILAA